MQFLLFMIETTYLIWVWTVRHLPLFLLIFCTIQNLREKYNFLLHIFKKLITAQYIYIFLRWMKQSFFLQKKINGSFAVSSVFLVAPDSLVLWTRANFTLWFRAAILLNRALSDWFKKNFFNCFLIISKTWFY